jgi:hypothetical protein
MKDQHIKYTSTLRIADHEIHIFRIYVMSSQGTVKSEMITPLMTVSIIFPNHPNGVYIQ